MHYTAVMDEIQAHLDANGGRATTKELADAIGVDAAQIRKCAGYLGHVTETAGMYQPATVIDWRTLEPDQLPEEDKWLRRMFEKTGVTAIESARLNKVAALAGYSKAALARAYLRQGCTSVMIKGKWHRQAPGLAAATPTGGALTDDEAIAALASPEAPVVTDKKSVASEWIDRHRLQCTWVVEETLVDIEEKEEVGVSGSESSAVFTLESRARQSGRPATDNVAKAIEMLAAVGYLECVEEAVEGEADMARYRVTDAGRAWVGK